MGERDYYLLNDLGLDSSNYPLETSRPYHVQNLDKFLSKVYKYFLGKGFVCIAVARFLNLITLIWAITVVLFLISCVDYTELFKYYYLPDAIRYEGLHPLVWICVIIFCLFWLFQLREFMVDLKDNWEIKQFYERELGITEEDVQTIEWREIVTKLIQVPYLAPLSKNGKMTHLDIANRIMRKENYLIAMINKEVLNLEIPLPLIRKKQVVTKTLEWSISYTIFSYLFDSKLSHSEALNRQVLDYHKTSTLAQGLRRRFILMGCIGLVVSPFMFVFLMIYFIFKYGEEVHNDPSSFALRQWSPLARWKFRELNELPHVFQKRLNASRTLAEKYVTSFQVTILAILARFVAFIVGSIVIILVVFGFFDDDALLKLQVTDDMNALWIITIGGSIVAACRSLAPNSPGISEPDKVMEELVQYTHYMPKSWRGRTHTKKVLGEFNQLFEYKFIIFFTEIISVLFAPLILIFSLPKSAESIIFFFREYTSSEPGVGDVCKFAVFPLEEHGSRTYGVDSKNAAKSMRTKQGKMEKSFLNFKANYPDWQPSKEGEKYLSTLSQAIMGSSAHSTPNPTTHHPSNYFNSSMMTMSDPNNGSSAGGGASVPSGYYYGMSAPTSALNSANGDYMFLGSVIHSDPNHYNNNDDASDNNANDDSNNNNNSNSGRPSPPLHASAFSGPPSSLNRSNNSIPMSSFGTLSALSDRQIMDESSSSLNKIHRHFFNSLMNGKLSSESNNSSNSNRQSTNNNNQHLL